jgi:fatty-acyl-CoA synthase
MYGTAQSSSKGLVTGEPNCPVRHTWGEVHERARRIAGGLAAAGVGHGDAVPVLAGAPAEIAPAGQGVWMRGARLTMLHQPTPRTDLQRWAEETTAVIKMIGAKTVVISDPFLAAAPLLAELVKVTPMDFLRDILLWARLIDKYKGTMTAAPNFAYTLFARRLRKQAQPGQFDLSTLRWALSGAEQVEPADIEDLCEAGKPFGLRPEAILPAYGMAETTVAVSFSECGAGLVVDEVDADLLAILHRAVPATKGKTRRLATLGRLLKGLEARVVDEDGNILAARGVGVIQVRGEPVTLGYETMAGFVAAQDHQGWYDTGDLGYLTEAELVVVCGRVKDVIIMTGRNIYTTDIERAAARVSGVRAGCTVAVRLDAGHPRETFAVAVESNNWQDPAEVRRIEHQVAHEVVAEVDVRPRNVVVLKPGMIPKTPSGKLRRAHTLALVS